MKSYLGWAEGLLHQGPSGTSERLALDGSQPALYPTYVQLRVENGPMAFSPVMIFGVLHLDGALLLSQYPKFKALHKINCTFHWRSLTRVWYVSLISSHLSLPIVYSTALYTLKGNIWALITRIWPGRMETWKIKGAICDNLGITILSGRIGSHHVVVVLQQLSCHLSGPTNRLEDWGIDWLHWLLPVGVRMLL